MVISFLSLNSTRLLKIVAVFILFILANTAFGQGYVTIGTQTTQLANDAPSPVSGYYESRKIQIVYTAAEIIAAGGAAGNIERLAWDVTVAYDGDPSGLPFYTIQMGHIASATIPSLTFITGLTTVRNAANYIPATGFNDIPFDTPFNWNGTDNVIVEICFNAAPFPGGVNYGQCWNYTSAANSSINSENDGTDECISTTAINAPTTKPRVRFYMQQAAVTCDAPTTLTKYGTTATTTVLSWTNPSAGTPVSYLVEIRTSGAAGSGATGLVSTWSVTHPTSITTITGLTANTNYSAYVRTNCGVNGNSLFTSAVNFTTQCNSSSIPYTQNFDGATLPNLPNCTSREDVNGYTTWTTVTAPSSYTGKTLRYTYDFGGNPADDWFFTNGINLIAGTEYRLVYKYGANNPSFSERLKVCYGSSPLSTTMISTLANYPAITTRVNDAKVDFIPATTGAYYFGFHAYSLDNRDWLFLDDIGLDLKPVCNQVTSTNIYGFSTTTAIFSWTAALANTPPGNPASYQIELRTLGAAGSGPAGLVATYTITHPNNITTFTGLTANTNYSAFIRTDCSGGDYSNWSSIAFNTPCLATSVPYLENFDGATLPNLSTCTYKQDLNGGNTWITATAPSSYSGKVLQYSAHAISSANDWFYTNGLNLTAGTTYRLSFKYGNSNSSFIEKLQVKYGPSNSAETMLNSLLNFLTINSGVPQNASIDFSPSASGVYYFGFNAYSAANQSNLYLDDISLIVAPVCISPTNTTLTELAQTSAVLSWANPVLGIPLNYELEVRTSGVGGAGVTGLVSTWSITHPTNVATITGLTNVTSYTVYIRTNCGSGDYGTWVPFNSFTTPCLPSNIPYFENFNTTVYPNMPSCTYKEDISNASTWLVFDASVLSYPDFTSNCLFFEYDASVAANNWFFTEGLNLTGGITYNISYKYRADVANSTYIKISSGLSPLASSMTNLINALNNIPATTSVSTSTFTPGTTGIYYFGFQANSVGNSHFILIDDLNITGVPANSNSSLSNLTTSIGSLVPAFNASTFNYTVTLPFGTTGGATLTPTTAAGTSTTVVSSATNVAGTAPANVATVVVTAQSGATSTYTVTFTVSAGDSNSSLSNLTTSIGTLSPTFSSTTFDYTVNLPIGATGSATVTPTVASSTSTTAVTSATNVTGTAPANVATVVVTAQSGATSTYTVTYVPAVLSSDATLATLTSSEGTLEPVFDPSVTNYTVLLPEGSSGGATILGTTTNASATITSTTDAFDITGTAPNNTASITVTAEDGISTLTYYVVFNVSTSISKKDANLMCIAIYPNPTNGVATLNVTNNKSSTVLISVSSISGELVLEKEIAINSNETSYFIDLSQQAKGIYFIKMQTKNSVLTQRIILN